jgi:uncharacterized protein
VGHNIAEPAFAGCGMQGALQPFTNSYAGGRLPYTNYIGIGLAGGALAFGHCLGMCGGFALYLAGGQARRGVLGRQALWHSGRIMTYVFLGALAGFLGSVVTSGATIERASHIVAWIAGGVMIIMGLLLAGLIPRRRSSGQAEDGMFASLVRYVAGRPGAAGALTMGLATGFLPCPIVVGFLALSAQSGSVGTGMVTMASMGLGTVWSLLLIGVGGHMVNIRMRRWGAVFGGVALILLGTATLLRGTEAFHRILGCPAAPTVNCCDKVQHEH